MKIHLSLPIIVFALGLCQVPHALAQDDGGADDGQAKAKPDRKSQRHARRQARKLYQLGAELTGEQKYEEAVDAFTKAYELDPIPETLYNLGTVSHLKGEVAKAYEYYEKYLAADPNGPFAPSARRLMERLQAQLAEEAARAQHAKKLEAELSATRAALDEAKKAADESERARAEAMARAEEAENARAAAGATRGKASAGSAPAASSAGSGKRLLGASLVGVGGVVLGLGIKSGLDARAANAELDGLGPDDTWSVGYEWLHEHGQSSQSRMVVFSIAGAALVGGGVALYYLGTRDGKRATEKSVSVLPSVGPRSAGLEVMGRF